MMRNFTLQKRLILAGLGVLLLLDATLAFYNSRLAEERQNPKQVLSALKRQVELIRADVNRAGEIKKKIPSYLTKLDQFEGTLPVAAKGYSGVSEELGEVAKANHLIIDTQTYHQKELVGRDLVEVEVEAAVTGDYAGIVRFLNALQRSKNVFIVETLQLNSQVDNQVAAGSLRVSLHMKTYFRKA